MDITDFGNPEPRTPLAPYKEFAYPVSAVTYLPTPQDTSPVGFFHVVHSRTTRREFQQLSHQSLADLLWYSSKTKTTKDLGNNHTWQHRSTPSAGGRHPIDLMVISNHSRGISAHIYDPIAHALGLLSEMSEQTLNEFYEHLTSVFNVGDATILWFVAQTQRTTSAYQNGLSLVLRDVGALEATLGLVAEGLKLNGCSIGITGEPWVSSLLNSSPLVRGVGGFLIGAPAP